MAGKNSDAKKYRMLAFALMFTTKSQLREDLKTLKSLFRKEGKIQPSARKLGPNEEKQVRALLVHSAYHETSPFVNGKFKPKGIPAGQKDKPLLDAVKLVQCSDLIFNLADYGVAVRRNWSVLPMNAYGGPGSCPNGKEQVAIYAKAVAAGHVG